MKAYKIFRQNSKRPVIITCEHASKRFPKSQGFLGTKRKHLANIPDWHDVGAADLARVLSRHTRSRLIMPRYSRMIVNVNKPADHPDVINDSCFGFNIPGNTKLTEEQRNDRLRKYYLPYHERISQETKSLEAIHSLVYLVSVHSFFHKVNDEVRRTPDIGILYKYEKDLEFCRLIKSSIEKRTGFSVRFNQPYSAHETAGYTMNTHGKGDKFRCVEFEVNDRHLRDQKSIERIGKILSESLEESIGMLDNGSS